MVIGEISKLLPSVGTSDKVTESSESLGFILGFSQSTVHNLMAVHPTFNCFSVDQCGLNDITILMVRLGEGTVFVYQPLS